MEMQLNKWSRAGCLGCTQAKLLVANGGGGGFLSTSGSFTLSSGNGAGNSETQKTELGDVSQEKATEDNGRRWGIGCTPAKIKASACPCGCADHLLLKIDSAKNVWFGLKNAAPDATMAQIGEPSKSSKIGSDGECISKCTKMVPVLKGWFPNTPQAVVEKA